jgi:hypothetical protein
MLPADAGPALTGPPGISPDTHFTPVAGLVLTSPVPVKASDGKVHIAYELVLTNALHFEVDINIVEVRDAVSKQVVLSLTGSELVAHMNPIGNSPGGEEGDPPIAGSATSIVWLDVAVPSMEAVPETVDHRVVGTVQAGGPQPFESILTPLSISREKPLVLGPPVAPGTWLASEGCCTNITHHRNGLAPVNGALSIPQRFALDLFRLDDQHRTWVGDRTDVRSYLSYGQPAIAACDGTVVVASDGRRDQTPPETPPAVPIADTVGNHVIIKVTQSEADDAPGDQPDRIKRYLLYAHLKRDSIAVRVGQRVHRGDLVGLIGNSGFSSTPHLHFQVLTTPTFFPTDSTPYVFHRFDLVGFETARIWDENLGLPPNNGTIPFAPALVPFERERVMPLDRDIVTFSSSPGHLPSVP